MFDFFFTNQRKINARLIRMIEGIEEQIMSAIDNLNASITNLKDKVNAATSKISSLNSSITALQSQVADLQAQLANAGTGQDAAIQAAADAVNAEAANLDQAVNPPSV